MTIYKWLRYGLFFTTCLLAGCKKVKNDDSGNAIWKDESKLKVAATATMIADMARVIGGDQVEVYGMIRPNTDPHSYEYTSQDVAVMNSADVLFYLGLNFEIRMQKSLQQRKAKGENVFALSSAVEERFLIHSDGQVDCHIWGDPELWALAVDAMVEALSVVDAKNAVVYKQRASAYKQELKGLKQWAQERVAEIPAEKRVLISSHDAFQYFARSFHFKVRGLQGISTADEVGLKSAQKLIDFIKSRGIKSVFIESAMNNKGMKAVAQQAGAKVCQTHLYADSTGDLGTDQGTYIGMVKHNINTIVEMLK